MRLYSFGERNSARAVTGWNNLINRCHPIGPHSDPCHSLFVIATRLRNQLENSRSRDALGLHAGKSNRQLWFFQTADKQMPNPTNIQILLLTIIITTAPYTTNSVT